MKNLFILILVIFVFNNCLNPITALRKEVYLWKDYETDTILDSPKYGIIIKSYTNDIAKIKIRHFQFLADSTERWEKYNNFSKKWQLHSVNGQPALKIYGISEWWINGKFIRASGENPLSGGYYKRSRAPTKEVIQ